MTKMSDQMTTIEVQITNLEQERKMMSTELSVIQDKIDSFDRFITKTSIEISNVPKRSNETKQMLYETVSHLTKHLNLVLSPDDYRDVARLPSKKDQKTSVISVEFTNTLIKSQYLAAAKEYNKKNKDSKLNNTHMGLPEPQSPIYVAETLTPRARRLYYLTRKFIKEGHFRFCWTSDGKVFVKETSESPYFRIKDETQLKALYKPNPEWLGHIVLYTFYFSNVLTLYFAFQNNFTYTLLHLYTFAPTYTAQKVNTNTSTTYKLTQNIQLYKNKNKNPNPYKTPLLIHLSLTPMVSQCSTLKYKRIRSSTTPSVYVLPSYLPNG